MATRGEILVRGVQKTGACSRRKLYRRRELCSVGSRVDVGIYGRACWPGEREMLARNRRRQRELWQWQTSEELWQACWLRARGQPDLA